MSSSTQASDPTFARAAEERTLADLFALLERLGDVLASDAVEAVATDPEFETVIRRLIVHLRARGATATEVVARLTRVVDRAPGEDRSAEKTIARVAAVRTWCARVADDRAAAA